MKVCAVTTWPPHKDGVALYSHKLYTHLSKNADVQIIANRSKKPILPKNNIFILPCWKRGISYPLQIFQALCRSRCQVVHIQHGWFLYGGTLSVFFFPFLLAVLRLSNKPCIVTMHTIIRKDAQLYKNSIVNLLARMTILFISRSIVHFSDKVIVHNQLMKQILQDEYGAKKQKIIVIKHGTKTVSRADSFPKENKLSILSLGFLRKEKAIKNLIEAFKTLSESYPQLELVIVGTNHAHDKQDYCRNFKNSGLVKAQKNIVFTGFVDDQTLNHLIWASEIVVLQSTEPDFVEASGTLATVANFGKAVVCSKVPKFQGELKNKKQCLFVDPQNFVDIADALLLLIENQNLRNLLGKNLKQHFKGTSWNDSAKKHVELYNLLLNQKTTS